MSCCTNNIVSVWLVNANSRSYISQKVTSYCKNVSQWIDHGYRNLLVFISGSVVHREQKYDSYSMDIYFQDVKLCKRDSMYLNKQLYWVIPMLQPFPLYAGPTSSNTVGCNKLATCFRQLFRPKRKSSKIIQHTVFKRAHDAFNIVGPNMLDDVSRNKV